MKGTEKVKISSLLSKSIAANAAHKDNFKQLGRLIAPAFCPYGNQCVIYPASSSPHTFQPCPQLLPS